MNTPPVTLRQTRMHHLLSIITTLLLCGLVLTPSADAKKKKRENSTVKVNNQELDKKMRTNEFGLIGIRFHGNFANLEVARESDPFIKNPSRGASFGFGVTLDKALNRIFAFRAEVLYQNKNFSSTGQVNYNLTQQKRLSTNTYLDYLEVPLMMVFRFNHGKKIRPYGAFGVYGAALVQADGEQDGEGQLEDARRPFSTFDYGIVAAAGSYFVLGRGNGALSAELRYSQGMANIADTGVEADEKQEQNASNKTPLARQEYNINNFSLMVAYYF